MLKELNSSQRRQDRFVIWIPKKQNSEDVEKEITIRRSKDCSTTL